MPGKRYKHQMTEGPWKGQRCRVQKQDPKIPGHVIVEFRDGQKVSINMLWLEPIQQKSTR